MARRFMLFNACGLFIFALSFLFLAHQPVKVLAIKSRQNKDEASRRERISINSGWTFIRNESNPDGLSYDQLKPWILPIANDFISDPASHHERPPGNPGGDIPFVQNNFDDGEWEHVNLPHDWAIKGPFYTAPDSIIGGSMGRLPSHGVGWYRRKLTVTAGDEGKVIYLDIDGAMSYSMVWLNGNFIGGWPFGYNSFRLDLTPYLKRGSDNQLAIRLENQPQSSRFYAGAGLYRNVWLTKVDPTHVGQWGTYITSKDVSPKSATLDFAVQVKNGRDKSRQVRVVTNVYEFDVATARAGKKTANFPPQIINIPAGQIRSVNGSVRLANPRLWGPGHPDLYVAITRLYDKDEEIDSYETRFGVRSVVLDPNNGVQLNGNRVQLQGVDHHSDFGALGMAFNTRALTRQLETLRDLGCNAIRLSHNPPAPELLDLTDQMGFLVLDEIFDMWEREKVANDFHLIFTDWHEPDLRVFLRRDRNHPSIFAWSFGNEVGEQYTDEAGADIARSLRDIIHHDEPTRLTTAAMNYAKPNMSFPRAMDIISLNYQGEGIRDAPAYSHLQGIKTPPLYPDFHAAFPDKLILSSETASTLSTRGTYIFPVTKEISAPVNNTSGGNSTSKYVSAYELYSADWGASPDKVFSSQDHYSYVAGEFVWSGWDYLGEPTPYSLARSSYFGIIDLAGFKKDRYYLYQSRWRPDYRMAHILPHWNWPDRVGEVTPVHVFSSGDEAELFLNGKSQGRQQKEQYTYRFRWDDVVYQPGEVTVATYKNGQAWANATVRTTGPASKLRLSADRTTIKADGKDLSFITLEVIDSKGDLVRDAANAISFSISGPGEIVATDNGDPTDMTAFPSTERKAFGGLALAIVRASTSGRSRPITITATGAGLAGGQLTLRTQ